MNDKQAMLVRNNNNRRVDNFYVQFFKMPESANNYLGKQVKSVSRPGVGFDMNEIASRRGVRQDRYRVRYEPVSVVFYDDEEGLTSMFLYSQIMAQAKADFDGGAIQEPGQRNYKFDIKVELYNAKDEVTEGYLLRDCLISELTHSEVMYDSSSETNLITATIVVTDVDFFIMDRYLNMKGET